MARVFLYLACVLTASSSEMCEKEKCGVSSVAMIQAHQKSSVTRLAQDRNNAAPDLYNVITLYEYGQLTDLQEDLTYFGKGRNWIATDFNDCSDGGGIAERLLRSNESKVVAMNANCYYHNETYRRFFSVLEQAATSPPPFVLVFAGLDTPLNQTTQNRIRGLRGLKACYATNLQSTIDDNIFFPLPLGIADHTAVRPKIPWGEKKGKLLVPPMSVDDGARLQYELVLNRSEFAHLVDIWPSGKRVDSAEYLELLAGYKAVLSPPGRGYDCFRHWECLAAGSVPLVTKDAAYDMRLFSGTGAAFAPPADQLTPDVLRKFLDSLEDPSHFSDVLDLKFWSNKWRSHLL